MKIEFARSETDRLASESPSAPWGAPWIASQDSTLLLGTVAILLLGTGLRLIHLDKSLYGDEFFSTWVLNKPLLTVLPRNTEAPLYFALLSAWSRIFPVGEVLIRLPSVAFGILGIAITYRLARELVSGAGAIFAAFVVATSPIHTNLSEEARFYPLLFFLLTSFFFCYVRSLRRADARWFIGMAVAGLLALYTDYYAIIFLGGVGVHALAMGLRRPHYLISVVAAHAAILVGLVPWLPILLRQVTGAVPTVLPRAFDAVSALPKIAVALLVGYTEFDLPQSTMGISNAITLTDLRANAFLIVILAISFGTVGLAGLKRIGQRPSLFFLLACFSVVPILFAYVLTLTGVIPALREKYVLATLGPVALVLGEGIVQSLNRRWLLPFSAVAAALVILSLGHFYFDPGEYGRDEDWRGAAQYLEQNGHKGDVILLYLVNPDSFLGYYYHGTLDRLAIISDNSEGERTQEIASRVADVVAQGHQVWFLWYKSDRDRLDPNDAAINWLNSHDKPSQTIPFTQRLILYRLSPTTGMPSKVPQIQ